MPGQTVPIRFDPADPEHFQIVRDQVPTAVEHGLARARQLIAGQPGVPP